MSEFELLSGERLHLFVDRDLEWGEEWKGRIDRELQETTFFIPIITPRYFQSEECRRELVKFKSAADRFEVRQLLLPIYYVTVPEMEEPEPQDELMALVKGTQREDMRQARLAEESDATHRRLVHRLATRLLKISRETEGLSVPGDSSLDSAGKATSAGATPATDGGASSSPTAPIAVAEADPPDAIAEDDGSLDVLAAGETALSEWVQVVERLNREIQEIGKMTESSTPALAAADSFAKKLAVTNKLATELDKPAENIQQIAQDYSTQLMTVDPAIQTLIENSRDEQSVRDEKETRELFSALLEMVQVSVQGREGIGNLIQSMEEPAEASRELRQRLRKVQTSLRNIMDGQKILYDWEKQILDLYGGPPRSGA